MKTQTRKVVNKQAHIKWVVELCLNNNSYTIKTKKLKQQDERELFSLIICETENFKNAWIIYNSLCKFLSTQPYHRLVRYAKDIDMNLCSHLHAYLSEHRSYSKKPVKATCSVKI